MLRDMLRMLLWPVDSGSLNIHTAIVGFNLFHALHLDTNIELQTNEEYKKSTLIHIL